MTIHTTPARVTTSAFTILPTTPIQALAMIAERASLDCESLMDAGTREQSFILTEAMDDRSRVEDALRRAILLERPETAEDAMILLSHLNQEMMALRDQNEPVLSPGLAKALFAAVDSLCVIIPELLNVGEPDAFEFARDRIQRRFFTPAREA